MMNQIVFLMLTSSTMLGGESEPKTSPAGSKLFMFLTQAIEEEGTVILEITAPNFIPAVFQRKVKVDGKDRTEY